MDAAVRMREAEVRLPPGTSGGRTILGPIDLEVRVGERWVLLGPNGGGKTTLLRLAGALRQPSRGEVVVLGERLGRTDVRRLRERVGHVSHAIADRIRPSRPVLDVVLAGRASTVETWFQEFTELDRAYAREVLASLSFSSSRRFFSSPGSPGLANSGACRDGVAKRELPKPPEPPLQMTTRCPWSVRSASSSPVFASNTCVPMGTFAIAGAPNSPA
jgi:hypothetical protein